MKKLDEYLKITEAAEFLGISVNTLRKWADEGRIQLQRNPANGYRLFQQSDLADFLRETEKPLKPSSRKPR